MPRRNQANNSAALFTMYQPTVIQLPLYEPRYKKNLHLSLIIRKLTICICENKDTDQLLGNREAG